MMRRMRVACAATILMLSVILLACNGKNSEARQTGIFITPADPSIPYGTSIQFKAEKVQSDGRRQDITNQVRWLSSNSTVTISPAGRAKSLAIGEVAAEISASLSGASGTITLTVGNADLVTIELTYFLNNGTSYYSPEKFLGSLGRAESIITHYGTTQFTATGLFSDNSTYDLTNDVDWSSSDTNIATIDEKGLATSKGPSGATIISATSQTPLTPASAQSTLGTVIIN
jgi:hypothetical protein